MSLLNDLREAVDCLIHPLVSISYLSQFSQTQRYIQGMIRSDINKSFPLPTDVADKINLFLKENGYNSTKIQWRQKEDEGNNAWCIGIAPGEALITLSSKIVKEISQSKTLSEKHKFIIAHELGHAECSDITEKCREKKRIFLKNLVIISAVALVVFYTFPCTGYFSFFPPVFLGGRVGRIIATQDLAKAPEQNYQVEFAADRFAAKFFKGGAQAGIAFLEGERKAWVLVRNTLKEKDLPYQHITSEGDVILNLHPSLIAREEQLRKL